NNVVRSILEDKSGNLWFGTGGGVSKYDGQSFTHFTEKEGLSNNVVMSILEDKSGNLWFGTYGGGVSKYDGKNFTHFKYEEGLSNNFINCILQDRSGSFWFCTYGEGVSKLTLSKVEGYDKYSFNHYTSKEGLSNTMLTSIIEDKYGNFWFGAGNGVHKYDGNNFYHYTQEEGLSNNVVTSILEDKSGNLWFGTNGGGVSKYDGQSFTHFTEKEGLINNHVTGILEDKSGNLWFGTFGGVSKYDGHSFTHFTEKEGLSNNFVLSILEDKSGNLWFGTGGGVSKYDGQSFTHFTEKEGLINNYVTGILEDKSDNLWFGTFGGVSKYDGQSFTHFTEKEGLINNDVTSILQDKHGNFWIGTRFGLNTVAKAYAADFFEKCKSGKLTEKDIFLKSYSYEDRFLAVGINGVKTIYLAKDSTIWIGTNDRINVFHPEDLLPDRLPPTIQVTGIDLFNEPIAWPLLCSKQDSTLILKNGMEVASYCFNGVSRWYSLPEDLSLSYNNNYLTFNFIGITTSQPKKVKYQYKLEGMDENWSGLTSRNEATYGNIPPGTYTFLVKAMNSDGVWSKPFTYTFTIRPPWWKTWWAYSAYALFIIGSVYTYIRWRERALRARQKELEVKVDEATVVIRKQKDEVEEKNREILDSIEYAKRIQTAILPPPRVVKEFLKNSFILYIPKDIVAGDFYWMENVDDTIYFASCDCTGHGVPGAMVSVVCNTALNRAVIEFGLRKTGEIFDKTRELVLENFAKSDEEVKDGMDASLAALDLINQKMMWSGANNPLWIYRKNNNQIEEIKADKQPIGQSDKPKPFATTNIDLCEGDIIYLFTDGYSDQFGGEKNKKLTKAKFRELLLSLASLSMDEQRAKLLDFHNNYRG
ncbi:MAG: hypothetical protein RLZZ46_1656, partial [Bacteroidota bacterium]